MLLILKKIISTVLNAWHALPSLNLYKRIGRKYELVGI